MCVHTRVWASTHAQSCLTLCDPMDCSPLGSSNHGISRQEYWSELPFLSPGDLPDLGSEPTSLEFAALKAESFTPHHLGSPYVCVLVAQSCPTLCDPMDCSPPSSSVHGIFQARILEWVAISFSREFSWPGVELGSPVSQTDSLMPEPPGTPGSPYSL